MKYLFCFFVSCLCLNSSAQVWKTNLEEAEKEASQTNKHILLVFAGSDWCGPCIKLDKNVWQSNEFKRDYKSWVLVKADFPKKKANQLSPELTQYNAALAEKYNPDGNFPLVVLLNAQGKVIAKTGYESISAEFYLDNLHKLDKN